jgi:hypothetical protein
MLRGRTDRDRGATAVFLAFTLMLLIGVAAIAIDLAQGWNERRQDQTSVDIAAVAGALSFGSGQSAIADQVMNAARLNLDTVYSDADWTSLWLTCTGPPPAGFTPVNHATLGSIDCIGVNPSFLWVRLPEQIIATSFGKAIGVNTLSTSADVTVTLLGGRGVGSLPFAIRGNATSGEVCLDTGTGGSIEPPCDGNESGSFGNIAPPLFGNESLGTGPDCGHQSSANNYVPESIAMGIDHVIFTFSAGAWSSTGWSPNDATNNNTVDAVANMDECTDTGGFVAQAADGSPINAVYIDTGNNTKADITEGLMTATNFVDGDDARLTRSSNTRSIDGIGLDNNALWKYLGASATGSGPEDTHGIALCDGPTIRGLATIEQKNDAMRACLEGYPTVNGHQIFSDAIGETPRLGTAPRLWHNNLGTGISFRPVRSFDVVYLHGLWFDDKDDTVFYPDDGNGSVTLKNFKEIEQVTAYLLVDSMVSSEVHTQLGGFSNDTFQPEIFQ